ncbi:phosphopantothenoylcysteine decarboxylase / phosphopantothenate--cysteine ligase [Eubacterium uniforme]|uniref:Coenzyme A biosynthesis bifunctional protein CoaBC n=1 Tax=Eubacterium uniforme TaxID=39495 RepID=A0A1T4VUC0_9FIRM|nr:bifunctional phosphopantothenoylcysteine decarboxylase/phosphopantothenate--cysteine ligase CoaBC [Eubacterium uniforme]SKA68428.1 phosphopantothenoylcysteine decarboxylase / phosphopantothenate--cysteine ligase [Eubacterium uniforme]
MLKGKNIVLGVSGGIAAYKIANLASKLVKNHANVYVIMTENATNFINPITFETLTGNRCIVDTFDRNFEFNVEHVSLAKLADIFMIAPATANVIGKINAGIADDMLTTTVMAATCPVIISPAMNTNMYKNPITQRNINSLKEYGYKFIEPKAGRLACDDEGVGRMPEPEELFDYICDELLFEKKLIGKKVLVTAGPTVEAIDPVRFITNHSTGKMGYAIARVAAAMGAEVTLISGPISIEPPIRVNTINIESAKEMFKVVKDHFDESDIIIKSAAVADYTPCEYVNEKIKKSDDDMSIKLKRTDDILAYVGENKRGNQFVCGFSMETENMLENSKVKLKKKNVDMIVANNIKVEGAGFATDTNVVTFIKENEVKELPIMNKLDVAYELLKSISDEII